MRWGLLFAASDSTWLGWWASCPYTEQHTTGNGIRKSTPCHCGGNCCTHRKPISTGHACPNELYNALIGDIQTLMIYFNSSKEHACPARKWTIRTCQYLITVSPMCSCPVSNSSEASWLQMSPITNTQNLLGEAQTKSDLIMMCMLKGKERNRSQWEALLYSAGLVIKSINATRTPFSIIIAKPAEQVLSTA